MSLENHMVVGQDEFDEEIKCTHEGEWAVDEKEDVKGNGWLEEISVVIRCVDCSAIFEGHVSEVGEEK